MRKVAPEIDELMWALAEARDEKALDEFAQRFPELRGELGKRLALTASLKGAHVEAKPSSIPRFRPKPMPQPVWTRPVSLAAAGLALCALAFGSYVVTMRVLARPKAPIVENRPAPVLLPPKQYDEIPPVITPSVVPQIQDTPDPNERRESTTVAAHLRPQSISIKEAPFTTVIELIGQSCGLRIEMPDLPPELAGMSISAEYDNLTGMAMLRDLGSRYGFTPFEQGGNKVLLIPATQDAHEPSGGERPADFTKRPND